MRLLVTGANGFVGRALLEHALSLGLNVRGAVRTVSHLGGTEFVVVGAVDRNTDWSVALRNVTVVVHLAARVHVMKEAAADPLAEFLKVNLQGTENLAKQAARHGVKRLVYVSSIKVNGERTMEGMPFTESDEPNPQDPYGVSKFEAEQALRRVAQEAGIEIVIVRPPLIYGPGVKGNFAQMLAVLAKRIPLPLASVRNRRSLVYVRNFADVLAVCATHPAAAGQTYLVSDGEDISTSDMLRRLGAAMGCPARLFPFPPRLLELGGRLTGKSEQVERLLGSLQVNSSKIRRDLDWTPPYTLQQGLQATAAWFSALKHL